MSDDFCDSPEYADLIASFTAGQRSARELADALCERDETYHGYVWYLIASDLGDDGAADDMDTMRDQAWNEAIARFGIPTTADRDAVAAALAKIFSLAGWTQSLDITRPLGPALPYRPHHLHSRHSIEPLD